MADSRIVIVDAISALLEARDADDVGRDDVTPDARLSEDLRLDSLELAELSEVLADALGQDPYTEGLAPETVADVIAFYEG